MATKLWEYMSVQVYEQYLSEEVQPQGYQSRKYRTWRTLWLVKRTKRVPVYGPVRIQLSTEEYDHATHVG